MFPCLSESDPTYAGTTQEPNYHFGSNEEYGDDETIIRGDSKCQMPKAARKQCGHLDNMTQDYCESLSCCWDIVERRDGIPQCFMPSGRTNTFEYIIM